MSKRQEKVKSGIEGLKRYINTYDRQVGYLDYTDRTIIEDILYGLGLVIDKDKYCYALGFDKFKEKLREHLREEKS